MIKKRTTATVQGSLIAIEPASGKVVALVGGRSYGRSQYNRVMQARRQPGSTFKPFVYLAAFEATFDDPSLPPITPATVVEDAPAVFFYEDKEYIPTNYEDTYHGMVTLRHALAMSMNVATVKVAEMVGYDKVADLWSKKLGIGAPIQPYPAIALGSFEATPYEMATRLQRARERRAQGRAGHASCGWPTRRTACSSSTTRPCRSGSCARSRPSWSPTCSAACSTRARPRAPGAWASPRDAAGKTGTTNDYRDAWFAGFTPDLLCVVWVGFDDNTPVGPVRHEGRPAHLGGLHEGRARGRKPTPFPPAARGHRLRRHRQGHRPPRPAPLPTHAHRGLRRRNRAARALRRPLTPSAKRAMSQVRQSLWPRLDRLARPAGGA